MSWIAIILAITCWIGVCFMAWALVRAGDLADKKTKRTPAKQPIIS